MSLVETGAGDAREDADAVHRVAAELKAKLLVSTVERAYKPYCDPKTFRAFDLETIKIARGRLAPKIVCGSVAEVVGSRIVGKLLAPDEILEVVRAWLLDDNITLVGMNIAFDLACLAAADDSILELIFRAFDDGRIYDIAVAMQLDAIAGGHLGFDPRQRKPDGAFVEIKDPTTNKRARYNLNVCVDLVLGRTDAKINDVFRTSYGLLIDLPLGLWPATAQQYPVDDAENTLEVALKQLAGWKRGVVDDYEGPVRNLVNLQEQVEAAFCLHLGSCWGLLTDRPRVEALTEAVEEKHRKLVERFQKLGWVRSPCAQQCGSCSECKEAGKENTVAIKRAIAAAYGASGACPRCEGSGKVTPIKQKDCRGEKLKESRNGKRKGSYEGCLGASCATCEGHGVLNYEGDETTCRAQDGGCDGTGYDLTTAPMLPRTDKGGVKTDRDASMESGDDDIYAYSDNAFEKIRLTYVPYLRTGVERPIKYSPNVLVATGRCSYEGSPVHQFARKGLTDDSGNPIIFQGYSLGTRECICARPGCVLCSTDYSSGELCTLAQVCLWTVGNSRMADIINQTRDPGSLHTYLGSKMLGLDFEEMKKRVKAKDRQAKDFRQASKSANFGYPGGLGSPTLVIQNRRLAAGTTMLPSGQEIPGIRFCVLLDGQKQCGVEKITKWGKRDITPACKRCIEVAEELLKPAFFDTYPEVREYLDWVSAKLEDADGVAEQVVWNPDAGKVQIVRRRGNCTLTSGANSMFQGLLADIGKRAFSTMTREAYMGVRYDDIEKDEMIMFLGSERVPHVVKRDTKHPVREATPSPLAGSRFPLFIHDEPLAELPEHTAHLAGPRIAEIMIASGKHYAPDVYWWAEPALSRVMSKDAEPVWEEVDGVKTLRVWEPKGK